MDIPKLEPPTTYMGIISDLSIWHQKTNHPAIPLASLNSFVFAPSSARFVCLFWHSHCCCLRSVCVCAKWKCDRRANKIQMCGDCRSARTVASSYDCQTELEKERESTEQKANEMRKKQRRRTLK